jgi:hypothetical protein
MLIDVLQRIPVGVRVDAATRSVQFGVRQTRIDVRRDNIRITLNVLHADRTLLGSGVCASLAFSDELGHHPHHESRCGVPCSAPYAYA